MILQILIQKEFAIENNPIDKQINHWDNTGNVKVIYAGGVTKGPDYRKLGETWSTPRIIRLKINGNKNGSSGLYIMVLIPT